MKRTSGSALGLIVAVSLAAATAVMAQQGERPTKCGPDSSMTDLRKCAGDEEREADKEMRAALEDVVRRWSDLPKGVEHLKKAQESWERYRDEQCLAEGQTREGGSSQPLIIHGCRAALASARAKELTEMIGLWTTAAPFGPMLNDGVGGHQERGRR